MKIQADTVTVPFSGQQEKRSGEGQTWKEALSLPEEQPVKVSFSKEGIKNYRNSISGGKSYEEAVKQKELLKTVKLSADLDYSFRFRISESLSAEDAKAAGGPLSLKGRMENMAETYMSLYDEIVQGYESGTRKINVADVESEQGYRTLTMEEELEALDAAYENAVRTTEELGKQNTVFQKAIKEYRNKLEQISLKKTGAAYAYINKPESAAESVPDCLSEKMLAARDGWKNSYTAASKSTAWQGMLAVINSMFR